MMMHRLCNLSLAIIAGIVVAGCQSQATRPQPVSLVKLGFELESDDLASLVNLVTLTISYTNDFEQVDTLLLVDGEVLDTVTVEPDDPVVFTLRAFSATGTLLYIGTSAQTVLPGQDVTVDIRMAPPPDLLMLRVGPLYQSVALADSSVVVFVDVHNVDSLFGVSFRLEYDPDVLGFVRATPGDFLDSDSVETLAFARADSVSGFVAFAATRLRDPDAGILPPGISGSGRLASFMFRPRATGRAVLRFIDDGELSPALRRSDNNPVDGFANLVLESATVEITAGDRGP